MNLDDLDTFRTLDPSRMIDWIDRVPQLCLDAWQAAQAFELPAGLDGLERVVITGMGGSAMGGMLARALAARTSPVPVEVVRDYELPAHVRGPRTLVIASSYSGNTEETLAAFAEAGARGARRLALSSGGALAEQARAAGVPWAALPATQPVTQPRTLVPYTFVWLLGLFGRLGLIAGAADDLHEAVALMQSRAQALRAESPVARNPAKRLAGQLVERIPVVFGAGVLAPVAERWKGQFNENAKTWSGYDALPELDHNTLSGTMFPSDLMTRVAVIILTAPSYSARMQQRADLTRESLLRLGIAVDVIKARGQSGLAQMLTALHYGDYTSYYLAMASGVDPTPIPAIEWFKTELARDR
jgi:glucose/mannose-6-phosphate isomerase